MFLSKFCWARSYKSQLNILGTYYCLSQHHLTFCCQVQALLPPKISEFFAEFTFSFMHAGTKEKIMKKKHGAAVIVSSLSQSHSFIRPWLTITQDMKEVIVCTLTTTRTGYYYYCVLLRAEPSTQTEQMDLRFDFRPIVFRVAYFLADIFTLIL